MSRYDDQETLKIHYTGKRFDDHSMPFDMLDDLNSIEGMILDVASEIYKKNHNARRVPRGFRSNHKLSIRSMSAGSTVLEIGLPPIIGQTHIIPTEADQSVMEGIEEAVNFMGGGDSEYASIFRKYIPSIGSKLRDDEMMKISFKDATAHYDQKARSKLMGDGETGYKKYDTVYGKITEADEVQRSFKVSPVPDRNEKRINIGLRDAPNQKIGIRFDNIIGKKITITGTFDVKNDGDCKIDSIESMQILDESDVDYRLRELMSLEKGWGEYGDEIAPDRDRLNRLIELYDDLCPEMKLPLIFPTVEGNILMEWESDDLLEMEIDLWSMKGTLYRGDEETVLDLSSEEDWNTLSKMVGSDAA